MRTQIAFALLVAVVGCDKAAAQGLTEGQASAPPPVAATAKEEPPAFNPPSDPNNIVNIAGNSKDHTTLAAALKAANYLPSLANPGPFTVFAPTNAAFDKLPKGTVEGLVKPEKQADLREVLKYHVAVSVYQAKDFKDGQVLGMANGGKVTFHVKDGKVRINDATIIASIPASNGIVHVVDGVLTPPAK